MFRDVCFWMIIFSILCKAVHSELYACGNVSLQLTDPAGTITSPGFDTNVYDNDLECLWIITPQMGHVVQLTFHTLDIEDSYQCGKDSLSIPTDGDVLYVFCGIDLPRTLTIKEIVFGIYFITDSEGTARGFNLTYRQIESDLVCHNSFHGYLGYLPVSITDDFRSKSKDCIWTIIPRLEIGLLKQIFITEMDIVLGDRCQKENIKIKDDEGLIGVYCGREPPPIISTTARGLHLVYHFNDADNIHRESFFKALYAISDDDLQCGGIVTKSNGTIQSPDRNNDGAYDNDLYCAWMIVAPQGFVVEATFRHFSVAKRQETGCLNDTLLVIDFFSEQSEGITYCGIGLPEPYKTTSNALLLRFETDSIFGLEGFRLQYKISCGSEETCRTTTVGLESSSANPLTREFYSSDTTELEAVKTESSSTVHVSRDNAVSNSPSDHGGASVASTTISNGCIAYGFLKVYPCLIFSAVLKLI